MIKKKKSEKLTAGWREWGEFPDLGVEKIKVKLDTGARTSSLHAFDLQPFTYLGKPWIQFEIHPIQRNNTFSITCTCPIVDFRWITSSTGHRHKRYIIHTLLKIGDFSSVIDVSLANRDEMGFRFLLGRNAMKKHLLVDPSHSFLLTHKTS